MRPERRHLVAALLAVLVTLASIAVVLVALDQASGEQLRRNGDCCDVEFIDTGYLQLTWLLFPVLGAAAWLSARVALVGLAGLVVPQWLATNEVMDRYDRSGWGDGLEVLAYAVPVGVLVVGGVTVLVAGVRGRLRRHPVAQDQ